MKAFTARGWGLLGLLSLAWASAWGQSLRVKPEIELRYQKWARLSLQQDSRVDYPESRRQRHLQLLSLDVRPWPFLELGGGLANVDRRNADPSQEEQGYAQIAYLGSGETAHSEWRLRWQEDFRPDRKLVYRTTWRLRYKREYQLSSRLQLSALAEGYYTPENTDNRFRRLRLGLEAEYKWGESFRPGLFFHQFLNLDDYEDRSWQQMGLSLKWLVKLKKS